MTYEICSAHTRRTFSPLLSKNRCPGFIGLTALATITWFSKIFLYTTDWKEFSLITHTENHHRDHLEWCLCALKSCGLLLHKHTSTALPFNPSLAASPKRRRVHHLCYNPFAKYLCTTVEIFGQIFTPLLRYFFSTTGMEAYDGLMVKPPKIGV